MSNKQNRPTDTIDAQIGQAWAYHYKKDHATAVTEFYRLVEQDPSHIDANYGLALSLAALGRSEEARVTFNKVLSSVTEKIDLQQDAEDNARYSMLHRMVSQQLEKLNQAHG